MPNTVNCRGLNVYRRSPSRARKGGDEL
ncbi:unnamed protein product [Cuscuta epithymum]|uniref:Uncharacterized protein n=1 Tax=Cuscuta epithymum TaxID=186058 RepID=A0AAV0CSW4_9ASTE|nr:unnamed protein product [Cuscuta epithymum]